MRIAWFECATGLSGDMTLAALIDAGADIAVIRKAIASLNLPDVVLRVETVIKGGFRSLHVLVDHPEQHAHRHFTEIRRIVEQATELTPRQRQLALQMFLAVAEAEACVHGSTVEQIHFHEVGAIDSIADIVGVAVAFDLLGIERVVCNAIPPGRGFVKIDHGICPIPAPGTAEILKGIPLADIPIEAELTTPTGAAIAKILADSFGPMPAMTIESIGCGCGTMNFPERANVLRIFIGTATVPASIEHVVMLETNLDDVPGESIGHVRERLTSAGALDVFVTSVQMKKDRPGVLLSVLCRPDVVSRCEDILFAETGTLGIRRLQIQRTVQHRDIVEVDTPWGKVRGKRAWRTGRQPTFSPEFEDCARVARDTGVSLRDIYRAAESAFACSG
ncbi:MAG TPA: nickel pincer cofactor biosynthesis protein LarC, partial [Planctomycetaceae bacterium]|nr:nickel pincer cofactor biosynthesis protein LarC [Planctomycetaceae bacterium]